MDPDDEDRTFYRQVMGAVAELDRAKTLRRLRAGRRAKLDRDHWGGGTTPYGYRAEDKRLVPDDAREPEPGRRVRQRNRSRCGTDVPNLHTEHDKN